MQLKNALIGALVGGLLGVGFLIAAFMFFGAQHTALALIVALLVGAGVRTMVSTKGHASYLRGALTALVAVAAFVGGNIVVAKVAQSQMAANASKPMRPTPPPERALESATKEAETREVDPADTAEAAGEESANEATTEATATEQPTTEDPATEATSEPVAVGTSEAVEVVQSNVPTGKGMRGPQRSDYRPMDFILFFVAMLIAYELGRGSGTGATNAVPEATATA